MALTYERLLEIQKITKEFQRVARRNLSLSETRSLCSHIPVSRMSWCLGGLKRLSAKEAIVLCLQLTEMHRDWAFSIWMEIFPLPKKYQYEGDWEIVHQLLRNRTSLERKVNILLERGYTARSIFGMLHDKGLSRLSKIGLYDPYRHKVKRPQRKRGYNDHGSRRESHRWLPWNAYAISEKPKIDREHELMDVTPNFTSYLWHRIKTSLTPTSNNQRRNC